MTFQNVICSLYFTRPVEFAITPDYAKLDAVGSGDITIQVWFKTDSTNANSVTNPTLLTTRDSTNVEGVLLGFERSNGQLLPRVVYGNEIIVTGAPTINDDTWYQYTLTVEADLLTIYIDDNIIYQNKTAVFDTYSLSNGNALRWIFYGLEAASISNVQTQFLGSIGEIAIWGRALTINETLTFSDHALAEDCSFLEDIDLLYYYPIYELIGQNSQYFQDFTSNPVNGTLGYDSGVINDPTFINDNPFNNSRVVACTSAPTTFPSSFPSNAPSSAPIASPTNQPTEFPSDSPTLKPTVPTRSPTDSPTQIPTNHPSFRPSENPSKRPTYGPTVIPTNRPTWFPTPDVDGSGGGGTTTCHGDPHITTSDGLLHHYQGVGYFDFITPCAPGNYDATNGTPFRITGEHAPCNWNRACLSDVLVTIYDNGNSDDNITILYTSTDGGMLILIFFVFWFFFAIPKYTECCYCFFIFLLSWVFVNFVVFFVFIVF